MSTPEFKLHQPTVTHIELPTEPLRISYNRLSEGLRDREDTVTWRTMAIETRKILGSPEPERTPPAVSLEMAESLVSSLTADTYLNELTPEILWALGYQEVEHATAPLDALIISARHKPEWITWALADVLFDTGRKVAVVNPVGHYADNQPRIVGPRVLLHEVDTAVFITSTQNLYGGSMSTLVESLELLREPEFSSKIKNVAVVIPMFGGSRGHKLGQSIELGNEVLQTRSIPNRLTLLAADLQQDLGVYAPNIKFYSVDIHNDELPGVVFRNRGYEFVSISPMKDFAFAIKREIHEQQLEGLPLRLVAIDRGAVSRTENLGVEILKLGANGFGYIDIIEVNKVRNPAGGVESASVERVVRLRQESGTIVKEEIPSYYLDVLIPDIRVTIDDILDSGLSAKEDSKLLNNIFKNTRYRMSAVSHFIGSKGIVYAVENTGSDAVLVGNTLTNPALYKDERIRVVDISSSIAESLFGKGD